MILLLGHTGYIGSAFVKELNRRGEAFKTLPREIYSNFSKLTTFLDDHRFIRQVINASGFTGRPNVDACELNKVDTLRGNLILPLSIMHACCATQSLSIHVSSGCIYNGDGPYSEEDEPNFCFDSPPCSFYSGVKQLAEESLGGVYNCYIMRLRLPFDEFDMDRNYLSKLLRYPKLLRGRNSISHRGDFVKATLDLLDKRPQFGIYNVTNPGSVTTEQVAELLKSRIVPDRLFEYWDEEEFYKFAAVAPRSNCVLNTLKLAKAGVRMRPVMEALEDSIENWKWEEKAE